jgi:hypothetical protein
MTTQSADPGAPPSDAATPDAPAAPSAEAVELAALKASIAASKQADKDARKAVQADAEKAGQLAQALDVAKARLAELEAAEPMAAKWREYEANEVKRLDAEAAALPDAVKSIYAKQSGVDAKAEILAAFRSTVVAPAAPAKGTPPPMGSPPAVTAVDFAEAMSDPTGKKVADAKARDPQGWASWIAGKFSARPSGAPSLGIAALSAPRKA